MFLGRVVFRGCMVIVALFWTRLRCTSLVGLCVNVEVASFGLWVLVLVLVAVGSAVGCDLVVQICLGGDAYVLIGFGACGCVGFL